MLFFCCMFRWYVISRAVCLCVMLVLVLHVLSVVFYLHQTYNKGGCTPAFLFCKGEVIRATFLVQLVVQQCCVASCTVMLRVLPPCCKLQQHVARSRTHFYFVQHVAATCNTVVIRATLRCNLQRNIVARQVALKMLPVLLHLNRMNLRNH